MDIKAPRGTFDILPDDAKKRMYIESIAAETFEAFGYRRVVTPVFERTELFQRGIGEATEIVQKEMYTFNDKAGRSLTLRPEGTAPVVRAFIEHNMNGWTQPVKLYYSGQMFRYERPQAGRYREFWQIGAEAMGSDDPALDAEIILLLVYFLRKLGLKKLDVLINSMGCHDCRTDYVLHLKDWLGSRASSLCEDCRTRTAINPLRVFDCKQEACQEIISIAPKIDAYLCVSCLDSFNTVRAHLGAVGLDYKVQPSLVRGFDYYTKTTFEIQTGKLGAQNALGGGGRYDNLVSDYGGPDVPGIGFAIGTDRVLLALEAEGINLPSYEDPSVFIIVADETARPVAFQILFDLRQKSIKTEMDYLGRGFKGQLKQANKQGARFAIIIGPDELAESCVGLKDMETSAQESVKISRIVDKIEHALAQ